MFGKNLAKKFAPQIKQAIANQAKPNPSRQLASRGAQAVMSAMKKRGFADGGSTMSDAEKQAREEMAERKMQEKLDKAYSGSLTNTEYAPAKKDPRDAVRGQKGYAKGGSVGSASKRADGCATKGKTKGTMVKMNYGGKC